MVRLKAACLAPEKWRILPSYQARLNDSNVPVRSSHFHLDSDLRPIRGWPDPTQTGTLFDGLDSTSGRWTCLILGLAKSGEKKE